MIRRDYILRMIEECVQALTQIRALRQNRRWEQAQRAIDAQCQKLAAAGASSLAQLSETELLARLAQDQPTQTVRARLFLIISLLQEAGEIAAAEGKVAEAREICLKALHLLLDVSAEDNAGEHPAYVPSVELLVQSLAGGLPGFAHAALREHRAICKGRGHALLDSRRNGA